jgi:hypothetical protein
MAASRIKDGILAAAPCIPIMALTSERSSAANRKLVTSSTLVVRPATVSSDDTDDGRRIGSRIRFFHAKSHSLETEPFTRVKRMP